MTFPRVLSCALSLTALLVTSQASAVRILTDPATGPGDPALDFVAFDLTPDGTQIIATALFNESLFDDRVYSLTLPNDFSTSIEPVQLTPQSFLIAADYDVDSNPVVSPDGSTVLHVHDGRQRDPSSNTIHSVPIGGDSGFFNGLFSGTATGANTTGPGDNNFDPLYSPDGNTIFFINGEAGFGGTIPTWDTDSSGVNDPSNFPSVWGNPDWDVLYSVPAAGGAPVPVTTAADGDLDADLYTITPNGSTVVYAPDSPVATPRNRGDNRPTIYTVPATGGASTAIPMDTAPNDTFTVSSLLEVTPDGQTVVFIGDYDTPGKNELYSVPITGGTPTKLNDELHFAGDVRTFAISPDGASIAYAAGQTVGSSVELFLKPISGAGSSVRISDAAPSNTGGFDVSNGTGRGLVEFSPDSQSVYYVGDMTNAGAVDLYVVDTTEKTGLDPSAYTYVGTDGGDFTLASNWQDADGNPLPADISVIDNQAITPYTLIVDGDLLDGAKTVVASFDEQIQFGFGSSLEIINGATVTMTNTNGSATVDFDPGSALRIVDGSLIVNDDVLFDGMLHMENALLESTIDDIEFQDEYDGTIINSTIRAGDNWLIDQAVGNVIGSTFEISDGVAISFDSDVSVVDTDITLVNDVEPRSTWRDGEGTTLTLKGNSTITGDSMSEGTDLILEDQAFASLGSLDADPTSSTADPPSVMVGTNTVDAFGYVGEDYVSQIIFNSTEAGMELRSDVLDDESGVIDVRDLIINGLTGLSYNEDPSAWNVTDWDGVSALPLLQLVSVIDLAGDYNADGIVDAADYTVWRNSLGSDTALPNDTTPGSVDAGDFDVWAANYGATSGAGTAVPEPTTLVTLMACLAAASLGRRV